MDVSSLIGSYIGLLVLGVILIVIWTKTFRNDFEENKFMVIGLNIIVLAFVIISATLTDKNFPNKFPMLLICGSFLAIFLLFLLDQLGIIDSTVSSLVETFRNVIIFFENNSVGGSVIKGLGALLLIGGFISSCIIASNSDTERTTSKAINVGIYAVVLIALLMGFMYFVGFFRDNKLGSILFNAVQSRPNTFWSLFSLLGLGSAIPLAFIYEKEDEDVYKEKMRGCDIRREKPGGGYSMDTKEEIRICKEEARKKYEGKFPLTEYPLMALVIFLLLGYVVIGRKHIFNFLKNDTFRSLLVACSLFTMIIFIIFQVNSERYYVSSYPRTKTSPAIPDSYYIPLVLFFSALATILTLSMFIVGANFNNLDRPESNKLWENTKWLLRKLFTQLKNIIVMIIMAAIIGFSIYFYTGKKTYESGVGDLTFMMLGLALSTIVYKSLSKLDFFKNNKFSKLLLNLILLIPCILFFIIEYFYNDVKQTPNVVFAILLGEIMLVSSYILIPLMLKYFMGYYVSKNNTNTYELKKDELEKKLEKLKGYYKKIKSKVSDVIRSEDWDKILNNQYYSSKDNIKNYLEKLRNPIVNVENINKTQVNEDTDNEIRKISEQPQYKSLNRYEQIVNFVYYLAVNQLPDETYINKVSIDGIKRKQNKYELEKEYVEEKIKTGKLKRSIVILEKTKFLDKELMPKDEEGNYLRFQNLEPHMMNEKINDFSYNYGLSTWINIHNQYQNFRSSYNKYTNILDYSNNPRISYNMKDDILRVEVLVKLPENICCGNEGSQKSSKCQYENAIKNSKTLDVVKQWCAEDMTKNTLNNDTEQMITIFEKEGLLKRQKWNNIVINYDLGILDIFVNGQLEGSWNGTQQYMANRPIKLGENNGISGGICNVVYYPGALSKTQIEVMYNSLKLKNPPYI